MNLQETSKSSMVLYFFINLLFIFLFLSLRFSFLYVKPFLVRFLYLLALSSLPCGITAFLAVCSTHYEHELSPGMLDVSLILIQFAWCWSLLIIIDWHLVISLGFLLLVSASWRSVSNLSPSEIEGGPSAYKSLTHLGFFLYIPRLVLVSQEVPVIYEN